MAKVQSKQASFRCSLCDRTIFGVHFITHHRQNLKKHPNDISRCGNTKKKQLTLLQGMHATKGSIGIKRRERRQRLLFTLLLKTMQFRYKTNIFFCLEDNAVPLQDAPIAEPMPESDLAQIVRRAPNTTGKLVTRTRIVVKTEGKYSHRHNSVSISIFCSNKR